MKVAIINIGGVPTLKIDLNANPTERKALEDFLGGPCLPDKITLELTRTENSTNAQSYRLVPVKAKAE